MTNSTETKTPKLRFPEFDGEWEISNLGKSINMKAGSFVPAKKINKELTEYNYPCYGGNGLRGYTKSFTHVGKYSLIGRQGALCGNVKLVEDKFHATEHAIIVKHKKDFNTDFLFYTLKNLNLNRYATGQAQPGLSISNIKSVKFRFPPLPEQQKIADFLSQVDQKLNLLQQKVTALESYKKGVMQKLFSQEIRFKTDEGNDFPDWEEKKLENFMKIPEKISPNKIDIDKILTVKLHLKGVHSNERTDSLKIGSTKYYFRKKNQFIYGKQNLFNGAFAIVPEDFDGYLSSGDVPSLDVNEKTIDHKFLYYYFSRYSFYKRLESISSGSGSKRIHEKTLLKLKIKVPSLKEQTKIANFLSSIDQKTEHTQTQLSQTQNFKKGLLQHMFV